MFTISLENIIIILAMYILLNKYIAGLFVFLLIPIFSFSQELGFSLNYGRTTMLSDLKFNEKVDASYFPSFSINFDFANTRLDLNYGSNQFARTTNVSDTDLGFSNDDLNDINLNMANSFVSFVINQKIFSFNKASFLLGTGLTYGKVSFFRNLYNSQGYKYEIENGNYTINNQPVYLDNNFETKIGSDDYYGVNFNSEINIKLDDKLYVTSALDFNYNLSDNLDLRQESQDFDKQNDQFYSIKLGLRYIFSSSLNKSSNTNKINDQQSLSIQITNDTITKPTNDPKEFTLNVPDSFLSSEKDINKENSSEDIYNENFIFPESDDCAYFIVDTLDNSSSETILYANKIYHPLYCTESLIDALTFIKLNNIQNSKIINIENDLISNDEYVINDSNYKTTNNSTATKDITVKEEVGSDFIESSYEQSISSKTKKMYLDKDVDSLDINASPTFFVIVGVFSDEKSAKVHLNNNSLVVNNFFKRNNLFYCYAYSSNVKSDAINYKLNNPYESWIYERK